MNKKILGLLIGLFFTLTVFAANFRGSVINNTAYGQYPAQGSPVVLLTWNGYQFVQVSLAYTDVYGNFYFSGFPPGAYTLSIAGRNYNIMVGNYMDQFVGTIYI